jgi:hypothetical protein
MLFSGKQTNKQTNEQTNKKQKTKTKKYMRGRKDPKCSNKRGLSLRRGAHVNMNNNTSINECMAKEKKNKIKKKNFFFF